MKPKRKPICMPKMLGCLLVALGLGIFIAHIIPYHLLVTLFGLAITGFGISCLLRR